jgi:MarR family transcriptional regulator for hemolysin
MTSLLGRKSDQVIITRLMITTVTHNRAHQGGARRGGDGQGDIGLTDFQRDLLFLLHDLGRLLRVDADKRARAQGMTRAQWGILLWIERQPGLSQKELAELLEVEPISVARLVDRLESRAMVERRPDPKDRRIWRLHICPPAYPELREIHRHRTAMARQLTAGIDPAALEAMIEVLITMKTTLTQEPRLAHPTLPPGIPPSMPTPLAKTREVA